jgi:hypothetical protein
MKKKAAAPPAAPLDEAPHTEAPPTHTPAATVPATIHFIDNPLAPELFASEPVGFFMQNGVVTITLSSTHADHQAPPGMQSRVVVGRLVLPAHGAQALAAGLYDFLKKMGADPVPRDQHQTVQ